MRHDTRKINDENPLVTRGLYGGGGGGGGGGDSSGPGIGGAGIGIGAGDVGIGAGIGTGIGGASSVSGAGMGDVGSGIGSGIGSVGGGGIGIGPGQVANLANLTAGLFGMGIPSIGMGLGVGTAISGTAALADAIMGMHGQTSPGTPSADASSPGGMAGVGGMGGRMAFNGNEGQFDQQGNFHFFGGGYYTPQQIQQFRPDLAQAWAQQGGGGGGGAQQGFGGAPAPAAPAPAPVDPQAQLRQAQIDLVNQQRDIATQMLQRQNLLQDQLLAQQGLTAQRDAQGNITGYAPTAERSARDQQEAAIAQQLRQRTLDALAGNLPVDPALERGLGEQRGTLEATLRGNLGTGYATSTPGIQALADFDKRAEELRAAQRRDQLTTAEGLRLAGTQVGQTASSGNLASILGITNAGGIPAGILNNAGSGLNSSLSNLLGLSSLDNAYRIAQLQGSGANDRLQQQMRFQDNAGTGQLVGQLGSAFLRSDLATDIWDSVMDLF